MKKHITFALVLASLLMGCEDRFNDYLSTANTAPIAFFNGDQTKLTINDSLKTSVKHGHPSVGINLGFYDKENGLSDVSYNIQGGQGTFSLNNQTLNGSIPLTGGTASLAFTPTTAGLFTITFTATDAFKAAGSATWTLLVFDNLPPVASFTYNKIGVDSPFQYQLDASKSYDQDQFQGGGIQAYHWTINGKSEIWSTVPKSPVTFSGATGQQVVLEVYDNDGLKSASITQNIQLN